MRRKGTGLKRKPAEGHTIPLDSDLIQIKGKFFPQVVYLEIFIKSAAGLAALSLTRPDPGPEASIWIKPDHRHFL